MVSKRHGTTLRHFPVMATAALFALFVMALPSGANGQKAAKAALGISPSPTISDTLTLDSLVADSLTLDSLALDSLSFDSLALDSLGLDSLALDSLAQDTLPPPDPWIILPPDTTAPKAPTPLSITVDGAEFARHGYKDAGEMATLLPLLYPHQTQLYSQPFYPLPPGMSGRGLTVMYRGRSYDNPVTDATNFATYAAEEIQQLHLSNSWDGSGSGSSGPVLTIDPPHAYPTTALTRVVYRQGFYGLGHADWRIAQQITEDFAYHIGVDIGEYGGRFGNSEANTSMVRIGGRQQIRYVGLLQLYWMETRETHGHPYGYGSSNNRRNDLDIILSGGRPSDPEYREAALWYVRNQNGYNYGDEDGNRIGGRLEWWRDLPDSTKKISLRADVERTAARFVRRPRNQDPSGQRLVSGLTGRYRWDEDLLHTLAAVRMEFGTRSGIPDTISIDPAFLAGGTVTGELGDSLGFGLLGEATRSWRWPSMDESFGFWSLRTPDRWMDLLPAPDQATLYYYGNPVLDPEVSHYAAVGARYNQKAGRSLRVLAGYRSVANPIIMRNLGGNEYTRRNGPGQSAFELTGFGWLDLFYGISTAASWTVSNANDTNPYPNTWGWTSLRFDGKYYHNQLRIRLSITGNYYGSYDSNYGSSEDALILNGLATMKINKFELYYGAQNLLKTQYVLFDNYPFMHRSDIWGVRWIMWN
ncbi:hypothetical protein KQI63_14865 [bacterium]|nr:hypothetical protein [bacterium]